MLKGFFFPLLKILVGKCAFITWLSQSELFRSIFPKSCMSRMWYKACGWSVSVFKDQLYLFHLFI